MESSSGLWERKYGSMTEKPDSVSWIAAMDMLKLGEAKRDPEVITIAILGVKGAGKSAFISNLVGEKLDPDTKEVSMHSYEYNEFIHVCFIDTRSFDGITKTDFDVLREVDAFLDKSHEIKIRLDGIIYFHQIGDNRMQGPVSKSMLMLWKLLKREAYRKVMLVTSMWDTVDFNQGKELEKAFVNTSTLLTTIRRNRWQIARHWGTKESASSLVDFFVKKKKRDKKLFPDPSRRGYVPDAEIKQRHL
ncbi:hypothetical protein ASPZODRAFT_166871 [Penicilliopsis zonata CBS 506.65]|uniref:G domain-containing protein n=1 Tax=Penicilliopsis zonata CBS 506.65 TaxID=1073090 RepID=A0A1L9SHQ5_9EURO|nr:hypothetical protein ASPZODRAFT_166871 [Penicilliopsis zonata CBS 506.65]OJJ46653.1 hypothetical protein ASPZODRAFT_166871 [Penicilliopsis zonata CBS 506.65]